MDYESKSLFEISVHNHPFFAVVILFSFLVFYFMKMWFLPKIGRVLIYPGVVAEFKEEKVEYFEGRIMSSIHAIPCVILFPYAYFSIPQYYRLHLLYHPSLVSSLISSYDVGYMLYDMVQLIRRRKLEKEFSLMIVHHCVTALASFLVVFNYECPLGAGVLLMMESTTIFINNIHILTMTGLRESIFFKINALTILLFWVVFRFGGGIFYIRFLCYKSWDRYYGESNWFIFLLWEFTQILFSVLNIFWFTKLIGGFLKIVKGQKTELDKKKN